MFFESLTLTNLGPFAGEHVVSFSTQHKPVTLIGALNGAGKTTVLDSLKIALYGRRAPLSKKGNLSYENYVRGLFHDGPGRTATATTVRLRLRRREAGEDHRLEISRTWSTDGAFRESLSVAHNGRYDPFLTDTWADYIEAIIPAAIAGFFFFDGEQVEEIADPERARALLKTGVSVLLGADVLDRLTADLIALEKRKIAGQAPSTHVAALASMEREIADLRNLHEKLVVESAERQNELDYATKAVRLARSAYEAEGGRFFERRSELEHERAASDARLQSVEHELRACATDVLPLSLLRGAIDDLLFGSDGTELDAESLTELLSRRDQALLQFLTDAGASKSITKRVDTYLAADRETLRQSRADQPTTRIVSRTMISGLLTRLDFVSHRADQLMVQEADLRSRVDALDRQLTATPDSDRIASLQAAMLEAERSAAEASVKLAAADQRVREMRGTMGALEGRHRSLHENIVEDQLEAEDTGRIMKHSGAVRRTLDMFKQRLLEKRVEGIAKLILDSFRTLLRKQALIGSLVIDSQSFALRAFTPDGRDLQLEQLSAGERQLFAIALLWGVARASGRPLPVVIDTPLGRLDSRHRELLVQHYFPSVSHQVVLLSTDEEIVNRHHRSLGPYIGEQYVLSYDDAARASTITRGYFSEAEDVA
jgi:DNA sulfur modification protein DndD